MTGAGACSVRVVPFGYGKSRAKGPKTDSSVSFDSCASRMRWWSPEAIRLQLDGGEAVPSDSHTATKWSDVYMFGEFAVSDGLS